MKKLLKRIVTMAMAATMVAGLSSVAMAADKVATKTIYVQIDSSYANEKGEDKAAINIWGPGYDLSTPGGKQVTVAPFDVWGDKPYDLEKVSDRLFKITADVWSDATENDGLQVLTYKEGAGSSEFKISGTGDVYRALTNTQTSVVTLVAKVDGENYVVEVKDGFDPTAKTDDKKTEETKTDDKKATETKTDDKKTEETKTDDKKADTAATEAPKADAQGTDASPKTGDMAPIATAAVLGVVSLAGVAIALRKKAA